MSKLCQHNQGLNFGNQEIWELFLHLNYNVLFIYWLYLKKDTWYFIDNDKILLAIRMYLFPQSLLPVATKMINCVQSLKNYNITNLQIQFKY